MKMRNFKQIDAGCVVTFAVCAMVMSASVFTLSALLPDDMIEPKWYAAFFVAIVGGIVLSVMRLAGV